MKFRLKVDYLVSIIVQPLADLHEKEHKNVEPGIQFGIAEMNICRFDSLKSRKSYKKADLLSPITDVIQILPELKPGPFIC
jgi:hypothetical protein